MQDILEQPITTRRMIIICALLFILIVFRTLLSSNTPLLPSFPDTQEQSTQVVKLSEPDLKQAESVHLMGQKPAAAKVVETPKEEPKPQPVKQQPKPKKPLNVKVVGLIASSQQDLNFAILQEGGKKQKSYGTGEKLDDGNTVVKKIDSEKIIFDRDGADEIVYLYKPPSKLNPNVPSPNSQLDPFNDPHIEQPLQFDTPSQIQYTDQPSDSNAELFEEPFGESLVQDPFADNPAANIQYDPVPLTPEQQAEQMLANGFAQPLDGNYTPPVESVYAEGAQPQQGNTNVNGVVNDPTNPDFQNHLSPNEGDSSDPFFNDSPFADDVNSNFQ